LKESSKKKIIIRKKEQLVNEPVNDGFIRLNKYISNSGVCSRREADRIISDGLITINGEVVTELGRKISLDDDVQYGGKKLNPEQKVYLLLNKPRGFVTVNIDSPLK